MGRNCRKWNEDLSIRITIIDSSGRVLADSHEVAAEMDNHSNRPEFIQAVQQGLGIQYTF